jgi:hypothetical protein
MKKINNIGTCKLTLLFSIYAYYVCLIEWDCRGFWNRRTIKFVFARGVSADSLRMVSYWGSKVNLRRNGYTGSGRSSSPVQC